MAIYSEFSHEKWWFSIAMLVYQRVSNYQPVQLAWPAQFGKAINLSSQDVDRRCQERVLMGKDTAEEKAPGFYAGSNQKMHELLVIYWLVVWNIFYFPLYWE